jgi:hypothetical protein
MVHAMVRALLGLLLLASSAAVPQAPPTAKKYEPTWASLDSRPTPSWWVEQKFSLFMHWGLYAVPSYCPVTPSQKTCYGKTWHCTHSSTHAMARGSRGRSDRAALRARS